MRARTICMLVYRYPPDITGGAERQCRLQATELAYRGIKCMVIAARTNHAQPRRADDRGCRVVRVATLESLLAWIGSWLPWAKRIVPDATRSRSVAPAVRRGDTRRAFRELLTLAFGKLNLLVFMTGVALFVYRHRRSIDILHTHIASWNAGFAGWLGNQIGIPVVCKAAYLPAFHPFDRTIPCSRLWQRWRVRIPYIALTSEMAEDIARQGVPRDRITIIPNGVQLPRLVVSVGANRDVLYVGNLTQGNRHKGFDVLLEAWTIVHRQFPQSQLVMAGAGDHQPWMQLAQRLGCRDAIVFAGHVADVEELYRRAALLVLPSRGEGISNALLEAQSYGIPAVVSDIPGNREVVVHAETGLVVPVDNVSTLAEGMLKLMSDSRLRVQMGANARARIAESFAISHVANRLMALYDSLIKE